MAFMSRSNKRNDKSEPEIPTVFPRQQPLPAPTASDSYIGKTMKVEGELSSEENLTIEGRVKGTIKVSKTLTIGRDGEVYADIDAAVVRIIGKAMGNIRASEKVIIQSQGSCSGNIWSQKLVVAEGAVLTGYINEEAPKAAISAKAEASDAKEEDLKNRSAYDTREVAAYKENEDLSDEDIADEDVSDEDVSDEDISDEDVSPEDDARDDDRDGEEGVDDGTDDASNLGFKKKFKNKNNKRRR